MFKRFVVTLYPYFMMALLYFAFSWRLLAGDSAVNIYPDNEWFLGPIFSFSSAAIRSFEWPLWMNTVVGGLPLYNSPQVSIYYPFYFLFLNIWDSPLEAIQSLHRVTLLHVAILQINSYILFRTLRLTRTAAILGVMFIVFNLTTLEIMKWTHLIASYSWLPLYLAGLIRLLDEPWSLPAVLKTIIGFTLMSFAMVGQPLVFAGMLTVFLVIGRSLAYDKITSASSFRGMACASVTLIVALLISSIVLVPVISGLSGMIRWVSSTYAVVGNSPIPFEYFITDQLSTNEASSFAVPGGSRHDIAHPYVGLLPILFSFAALKFRQRHWTIVPLALVALYSFLSAFGDNLGLAHLNYRIPVVNKIREPSYFLIPLNITLSVLAAYGFDFLFRRSISTHHKSSKSKYQRYSLYLALMLVLCTGLLFYLVKEPVSFFLLTLFLFLFFAYLIPARHNQHAGLSLISLFLISLVIQLLTVTWKTPGINDSDYLRLNMIKLESAIMRIGQLDPDGEFRVIFGSDINSQTAAMLASYHGLRTLNSYVNPLPIVQFNEMYHHGNRSNIYSKGLGAKYLICSTCANDEVHGYRFIETLADHSIYVAEDALPRVYVTNNFVSRAANLDEYIQILTTTDLHSFPLILYPEEFSEISHDGNKVSCVMRTENSSLNELVQVTYCDNPAVLVLNEFFTDAWKASVNGIPVRPNKVNGNQVGVKIDAGTSVIRITYEPWSVELSKVLFVLGIILLLIIVWISRPFEVRGRASLRKIFR